MSSRPLNQQRSLLRSFRLMLVMGACCPGMTRESSSSPEWLDEQDTLGVVPSRFDFSDFVLEALYRNQLDFDHILASCFSVWLWAHLKIHRVLQSLMLPFSPQLGEDSESALFLAFLRSFLVYLKCCFWTLLNFHFFLLPTPFPKQTMSLYVQTLFLSLRLLTP